MKEKINDQNHDARKVLVGLTEKLSSIAQALESAVMDLKRLDDLLKSSTRKTTNSERSQARKQR